MKLNTALLNIIPRSVKIISFIAIVLPYFLHAQKNSDSIKVYFFLSDACRICQEMTPHINKIHKEFEKDFDFMGVFPNVSSTESEIEKFAKKYKIKLNVRMDHSKVLTLKTGATITPEVVVWDEKNQHPIFKGRINDLYYAPGKRKHHISSHDLHEILNTIRDGKEVKVKEVPAVGCFINFADLNEP